MRFVFIMLVVAVTTNSAVAVQWEVSSGGNGHFYDVIINGSAISWDESNTAAISMGWHLATITSQAESDFISNELVDNTAVWTNDGRGAWIGGFQPQGNPEPAGGYEWVTGEPFVFTNWRAGEPNGFGPDDDCIHLAGLPFPAPTWNDEGCIGHGAGGVSRPIAYVIELPSTIPDPTMAMETFEDETQTIANGWSGSNNMTNGNTFGFSSGTNFTGSVSGNNEAAGTMTLSNELAYYADTYFPRVSFELSSHFCVPSRGGLRLIV